MRGWIFPNEQVIRQLPCERQLVTMPFKPAIMRTAETDDASIGAPALGVQLRHARLVKGLRLKDLADLANCSESMISKIENNKSMPSLKPLHRMHRALETC